MNLRILKYKRVLYKLWNFVTCKSINVPELVNAKRRSQILNNIRQYLIDNSIPHLLTIMKHETTIVEIRDSNNNIWILIATIKDEFTHDSFIVYRYLNESDCHFHLLQELKKDYIKNDKYINQIT